MERDVLHHSPELSVALVIDEGDVAHLELTTSPQGADLTQLEDVIVIVDGQGVTVTPIDRGHARATLGPCDALWEGGFSLMVRVGEWLDGWDFGDELDEEGDDEGDEDDDEGEEHDDGGDD